MELLEMRSNGGSRGTGMRARTGGEEGVKILRYLFTPVEGNRGVSPLTPLLRKKWSYCGRAPVATRRAVISLWGRPRFISGIVADVINQSLE